MACARGECARGKCVPEAAPRQLHDHGARTPSADGALRRARLCALRCGGAASHGCRAWSTQEARGRAGLLCGPRPLAHAGAQVRARARGALERRLQAVQVDPGPARKCAQRRARAPMVHLGATCTSFRWTRAPHTHARKRAPAPAGQPGATCRSFMWKQVPPTRARPALRDTRAPPAGRSGGTRCRRRPPGCQSR